MKRSVVVGLLLLGGCKSTDAFMDSPPREVFHSTASPADVAFCIGSAVRAPAREVGDGSRVIRVQTIYGGSAEAFSIHPDGAGSAIEYRKAKNLPEDRKLWSRCLP